jgi:uncharacterized membrane protein (UPF0127 family)
MCARVTAVLLLTALVAGCGGDGGSEGSGATVRVGGAELRVEIADTPETLANGLSGRQPLGSDEGMLFQLPGRSRQTFWMKGMLFSIDIVWIANGRVIQVSPRLPAPAPGAADSELPLYRPRQAVDSALEVIAGWARRHGVGPGDTVAISR